MKLSFASHVRSFSGKLAWGIAACEMFAGGCGPADDEETGGIAVGVLLPFTGDEAALGRNLEQALLLAVADVNEAGGIGGQKLRLVTRDTCASSAPALLSAS